MKRLPLSILSFALLSLITLAASASVFQAGVGKKYGARDPRTCADAKQPSHGAPSAAQAVQYVICNSEHELANQLYLLDEVKVEVGGPRPFNPRDDRNVRNLDPKQPLYGIRGSYKQYQCSPVSNYMRNAGRNCFVYDHQHAEGYCYKDTFGDWHCGMRDTGAQLVSQIAAPPGGAQPDVKPGEEKPKENPQAKPNQEQGGNKGGQQGDNKDATGGDATGYVKPDFSEMDPYFEILSYKYDRRGALTVTVKNKVNYPDRPRSGWHIDIYDENGVSLCLQHRLVEQTFPEGAGKNETFTAYGCGEEAMKRAKKVVITKIA